MCLHVCIPGHCVCSFLHFFSTKGSWIQDEQLFLVIKAENKGSGFVLHPPIADKRKSPYAVRLSPRAVGRTQPI